MEGKEALREGKILFASGRPEESIPFFVEALEKGMDPVIVGLSKGAANLAIQKFSEAEEDFSRVLQADPENERACYFRGIARVALRKYEDAVDDLTRCLLKNHNRNIAYLARGLAYAELGDEKNAALDFNTASSFSSAEVDSFLKLFQNHKSQLERTMTMLRRENAPWKALLTSEDATKIRRWFA